MGITCEDCERPLRFCLMHNGYHHANDYQQEHQEQIKYTNEGVKLFGVAG